jgi:hypothetical protein
MAKVLSYKQTMSCLFYVGVNLGVTERYHGKQVVKNATAYMAQSLGFGKPSQKNLPVTVSRTVADRKQEPKPLADMISDIINKSKP